MNKRKIKREFLKAILFLVVFTTLSCAEHIWYQNQHYIQPVYFAKSVGGTFRSQVSNPVVSSELERVAHFQQEDGKAGSLTFILPNPIEDVRELIISAQLYVAQAKNEWSTSTSRIGLALEYSSGEYPSIMVEQELTQGEQWEDVQFNFSGEMVPHEVGIAGGYDQLTIHFSKGAEPFEGISYYLNTISGSQIQSPAKVLGGNWGVTFPVSPGKGADYDYAAGAREIVTELTTIGHVITNFTGFAHGQYFTLHHNPNVDIAAEIHPSSVPGEENDHVMEEVLSIFREAGIKTILYMALDGYHNFNATDEQQAAWENYYTTKFGGDEYAAYKDLMMGFISRTKDMCDGYWLDHTTKLPGSGTTTDFVTAIREIHPDAMISLNDTKAWLTTGPQQWVKVDSDGLDDEDTTDYLIITHESRNYRSDFTSGHVTPIGQGAPVNSWAYEEFTIPNMMDNPWTTYNKHTSMKHAWFPVRERWHVPQLDLVQEIEQAYRFVRRVTDGGAAITWANTAEYRKWEKLGHMMPDEMVMMKEINRRMAMSTKPDYVPYVRPQGAYLVGEEVGVEGTIVNEKKVPLMVSYKNRTLLFNQNFSKASIYTASGKQIALVNRTTNVVDLGSVGKGVYVVTVELMSGVKSSFRCRFQ